MTLMPRNDRNHGVTKFCQAMEDHRRTETGRVRTPKEFVEFFFSSQAAGVNDRLFVHLPSEVRAPIVAGWKVRGLKSALRDDDAQTSQVVHDALVAGDIDEPMFEEGVTGEVLVDWVPLDQWWTFWRTGRVTGAPVQRALGVARELGLFDDAWFLSTIQGRGGRLKGPEVLCDTLSKDQITSWIRAIHASGDGSPAGLVSALGWDVVLAKTASEALTFVLDALALKLGLVGYAADEARAADAKPTTPPSGSEATGTSVANPGEAESPDSRATEILLDDGSSITDDELVPVEEEGSESPWPRHEVAGT